jgi:hypothetical protein
MASASLFALRPPPSVAVVFLLVVSAMAAEPAPSFQIELSTILTGRGKHFYTQSRAAVIPGSPARVIVTAQETDPTVTHGYRDMYMIETRDGGRVWTAPRRIDSLRRARQPEGHDFVIGDVCPQWHAATGVVLATGKTFGFLAGTKEDRGLERVSYAVYSPGQDSWSELRLLELPPVDREGRTFLEANAGCNQRFDLANGEILLPIRYRKDPAQRYYTTIVARCRFDGTRLTYIAHGSEFMLPRERGLYEPSVTGFQGRYFLTMRADHSAFVARGTDGVNYGPFREWRFDDGEVLGSYNTQQHWVAHRDALYLVYTRRGAKNDHVMRHRAPLFIAQVDPDRLVVLRRSEQVLVPENNADLGAGFGVSDVSPQETWIVTSEIPTRGSRDYNHVILAKLIWKVPDASPGAPTAREE